MFTQPFSELSIKDVAIAGGKGASLGELAKAGATVPDGFVVLANAYNEFIRDNAIIDVIKDELKRVDTSDQESLLSAQSIIQKAFQAGVVGKSLAAEIEFAYSLLECKDVAVRSSATMEDSISASWAGELESFLFVAEQNLISSIKECWASLFTARAIHYRIDKDIDQKDMAVAVVIQEMIESEVSGICFTIHPVTKDVDQLVIEAGWGLGEAIVGGIITPDNYIVSKSGLEILEVSIGHQSEQIVRATHGTHKINVAPHDRNVQKLENSFIIKLAQICLDIEAHYGLPQDIEWAYLAGKFYIVQSRPITTL